MGAIWKTADKIYDKCGETAGYPATNTIDGDTGNIWIHMAACYHWITFDLGATMKVTKTKIYSSVGTMFIWGQAEGLRVYVSDDPEDFGDPVWEGVLENKTGWQESGEFDKDGRYVKLESKANGQYQMMCEFQAYREEIVPPAEPAPTKTTLTLTL